MPHRQTASAVPALLFLFASSVRAFPNTTGHNEASFSPFTLEPTSEIPPTFLSFNFDWNLNATGVDAWSNASVGWTLNLQDNRLLTLASALAPANLRVGGSPEDTAEYSEGFGDGGVKCSQVAVERHTCLHPERWEELIQFAEKAGLRLVFGLNIMFGRGGTLDAPAGKWNSTNTAALLRYTAKHYPDFRHGFGLGNEKEFALSAQDTASCYNEVRALINDMWPDESKRPLLVGPDLNPRPDWLSQFLQALDSPDTVDAVSYHMYVGYGRSVDLPSLILQPAWLDSSHSYIAAHHRSLVRSKAAKSTQIWITETAAAWASGTAGVCDGFVSGFWWLDQLGVAASDGHSAMCRQCLVGGNYSLIDQLNGMKPNPDYWSAWIHRQLMGVRMISIEQTMPLMGDYIPSIRAYMSCTSPEAPGYSPGSVTMVFINQGNTTVISLYQGARFSVSLAGSPWGPTPPPFNQLPRTDYVLTAPGGDVLSRDIALNGKVLAVRSDGSLPSLSSLGRKAVSDKLQVPAQSYGFAVYHNAKAPACQ